MRAADVADVVQETFLAAARSAKNYDAARGSLWVWLSGIARNHVALHYRKTRRDDQLTRREPSAAGRQLLLRWLERRGEAPEHVLASAELGSLVRATLTELPGDYEALLTAKYCDGVSVEQIAAAEKSSSTAIRSKLARARRAFRLAFIRTSSSYDDA
jgi:RNA polymerase sigma-70 factor (ECF subfamily)